MTNGYERPASVFDMVGGHEAFTTLVDTFYDGVAQDDYLIAMYPEGHELEGAKHRLQTFLEQYFGGPTTYQEERGHPRLRMRHAPYPIDVAAHDRWLELMGNSLAQIDEETIPPAYRSMIWDHMERVAAMLINRAP